MAVSRKSKIVQVLFEEHMKKKGIVTDTVHTGKT